MKNKLFYITYQSFPADTANSIQTISNLKYFSKNNYDVSLFFPLRERNSSDDFKIIDSFEVINFASIKVFPSWVLR